MWRMSDVKEHYKANPSKVATEPVDLTPFINHNLTSKIDELQDFDEESVRKISYWNDANESELARVFENADERDVLTVCYVAVRRFPTKYLTVLMDYILEREGK